MRRLAEALLIFLLEQPDLPQLALVQQVGQILVILGCKDSSNT